MLRALLPGLFLMLAYSIQLSAQCCSPGNPLTIGDQSHIEHKDLLLSIGHKFSTSDTYFHEREIVDIGFVDQYHFNFLYARIAYGLRPRISLIGEIGYFLNKTEEYGYSGWLPSRGSGIGDARFRVEYNVFTNLSRKYSVRSSTGITIPIGVFDQVVDNVKLPITVQPSSGAYKYMLNIQMQKWFNKSKWKLFGLASFEYARLIDTENFYYQYGPQYLISLTGSFNASRKLTIANTIRSENRGRSQRENDQMVESSGYHMLYTIPSIRFRLSRNLYFSSGIEIPVLRYYNGVQLGNRFSISSKLMYHFNVKDK